MMRSLLLRGLFLLMKIYWMIKICQILLPLWPMLLKPIWVLLLKRTIGILGKPMLLLNIWWYMLLQRIKANVSQCKNPDTVLGYNKNMQLTIVLSKVLHLLGLF
jgi:hypothetical protein